MPFVRSSQPATVAAAFAVTGTEYARFQERTFPGMTSQWNDKPSAIVYVCFLDGDFELTSPGPPDRDNTAKRIVVSVADGVTQLFVTSKTTESLPIVDPGLL